MLCLLRARSPVCCVQECASTRGLAARRGGRSPPGQHGGRAGTRCSACCQRHGSVLLQRTRIYSGSQQSTPEVVVGWREPDLCPAAVLRAATGPAPSMPPKCCHALSERPSAWDYTAQCPYAIQKVPRDLRGLVLAEDTKGQQDAEHPVSHAPRVLSGLPSHRAPQ